MTSVVENPGLAPELPTHPELPPEIPNVDSAPQSDGVPPRTESARPDESRATESNGTGDGKPIIPLDDAGAGGNGAAPALKPEADQVDPTSDAEPLRKSPGAGSAPPTNNVVPRIEPDALLKGRDPEVIRVAAGGKLIVPREDIGADIVDESELDLAGMLAQKVRKPGRREWIALNPASELTTRLLLHKPKADGIEVEHYYVAKGLRAPIHDELKDVRVFGFYSFTTRSHALWIVNVTIDNSWYESLQTLFQQPAGFFEVNAVRVLSDKDNSRYRVKHKPLPGPVTWPTRSTEELLGEALGHERFITTADHPIYRDLVEGVELA